MGAHLGGKHNQSLVIHSAGKISHIVIEPANQRGKEAFDGNFSTRIETLVKSIME